MPTVVTGLYRWAVPSEISDLCEISDLLFLSAILPVREKKQSLAITFWMCVV